MGDLTGRLEVMVCASGGLAREGVEVCNSPSPPNFWSQKGGPLEGSARCLGSSVSSGSFGSSRSPQTRSLRKSEAAILQVDLLDEEGDGQDLVSG